MDRVDQDGHWAMGITTPSGAKRGRGLGKGKRAARTSGMKERSGSVGLGMFDSWSSADVAHLPLIGRVGVAGAVRLPAKVLCRELALTSRPGILMRCEVPEPLAELGQMGVNRHAARWAPIQLERGGLVTAVRAPVRKTVVKLPDFDEEVVNGPR